MNTSQNVLKNKNKNKNKKKKLECIRIEELSSGDEFSENEKSSTAKKYRSLPIHLHDTSRTPNIKPVVIHVHSDGSVIIASNPSSVDVFVKYVHPELPPLPDPNPEWTDFQKNVLK